MELPRFNRPLHPLSKFVFVLLAISLVMLGIVLVAAPGSFWDALTEEVLAISIADVLWFSLLIAVPSAIYNYLPAGEITTGVLAMCSFAAVDLAAVYVVPIRQEPLLGGSYDMWFGILFVWYWHKKGVIDWTPEESTA